MKWSVEIVKVSNGYLVMPSNGEDDYAPSVFEEDETIQDEHFREQMVIKKVFLAVQEHFAVFNSKHNKTRLEIVVDKQE